MIKKHIPNSITCCNLISGCIATYFAFRHDFEWALAWMVIGAVFDFFDGMTARLLHVSSPIGKELDSLADKPEEKAKFIAEKEQEYNDKFSNPYNAARYGYIDDVIEPRNTRFRVIRALQSLATKRLQNPAKKHSNIPL